MASSGPGIAWLRWLDHNPNHHVDVRWGTRRQAVCTRCSGVFAGMLVAVPAALVLHAMTWSGWPILAASLAMWFPDYAYWFATRRAVVADINAVRVAAAVMFGIGLSFFGQADVPLAWKAGIGLAVLAGMELSGFVVKRRPYGSGVPN